MRALPSTLRGRLLLAMVAFAFANSMVMVLLVVTFAYGIEDAGFNAHLARESERQRSAYESSGEWAIPLDPAMVVVKHRDLPKDLRDSLADEPERIEYAAPTGRHYHFVPLTHKDSSAVWLLYDVTDRLIVRPSASAIWGLLVAVTLLVIAAGGLLAQWLSRRVTNPLSELVSAVRTAEPGALDWRIPAVKAPTEVAVLSDQLESLLVRLRAFVAREHAFTRDASHEIRTPLAVLKLRIDHLLSLSGLPLSARESLSGMQDAVGDLQRTVHVLLWLAREEALPAPTECTAVRPVLERAIIDQLPQRDGPLPEIDIDVPEDARLLAPPGALVLLIGNLIGNAFAHSGPGRITVEWDGAALYIENSLKYLGRESSKGQVNRVGFGLSVVKRVAERSGLVFTFCNEGDRFSARLAPAVGLTGQ